jgi:hypothetical protein
MTEKYAITLNKSFTAIRKVLGFSVKIFGPVPSFCTLAI